MAVDRVAELKMDAREEALEARALDEALRDPAAASVLLRAGTLLGRTLEVEAALVAVAKLAVPALADWCAVDLVTDAPNGDRMPRRIAVEHVDPAKRALALELAERYPDDPTATNGVHEVLRTGAPQWMTELPDAMLAAGARDDDHLAAIRTLGLCSYVIVPIFDAEGEIIAPDVPRTLRSERKPVGAITFVSAESDRRYSERDVAIASELARRAALALERARLYDRVVRDRERLVEQTEELQVQNERLQEQAAELEMQSQQLSEQATELEIQHEQLQQQAAELELSQEQLQLQATELEATTRQLTAVLEQSPMGVAIAEAPSGRFLFVSRRTHEIFGRSRLSESVDSYSADWTGYHVDGPHAGREVAPNEWPIAIAVEQGEATVGKLVDIVNDGGGRRTIRINAGPVLDESGKVTAGVAVFDDVSDERHAQRERERLIGELRVERARLAEAFQQAPAFVAVLRGPDHVFEVANEGYYQLVGFRDIVGKPVRDALPEVAVQGFVELLDRVRATGQPFVGSDVAVSLQRTPQGAVEKRFVTFVYQPLRDPDGGVSGVFVHGVDVTDAVRARAEAEAARAEAEAARARAEDANRAKSEFLASMSHELRTPLNAIGGYAELMELGVRGPVTDVQREDLARIRRSQRHLLTLINDILNFARIESGRVEYDIRPLRVADLVADVAPMIEPQISAQKLSYEVALPHETAELKVRADQEKVRQILLNLLSNAVKFTPAGGAVRVSVALGGADRVYVRVADTGIGIPPDKREAVFDAFVQVHAGLTRRHEGTGLGLAISRDLARGMGGDLTVDSEVGVGSTFTLVLPRA